jgi:renalase
MPSGPIAIVGAGLAGLACSRTLAAHDGQVRMFDKGRAPGGRVATRRVEVEGRRFSFDHGAQYLSAKGAMFRATLEATNARPWPDAIRRVGVPRMSVIPRALSDGMDLSLSREVIEIAGAPGAWILRHVAGGPRGETHETPQEDGPFEAVALCVPAPQAAALLAGPAPHLRRVLDVVRMAPCWTLMAAFDGRVALPDTTRLPGGPIAWAARDSAKPGRDAETECWVVHAGPEWSREHLEKRPAEIAPMLLDALAALSGGALPPVLHQAAHRWRYALVETPLGAPCLWDPARGLGAAGDWCIGPRAEAAAESGVALGAVIARG